MIATSVTRGRLSSPWYYTYTRSPFSAPARLRDTIIWCTVYSPHAMWRTRFPRRVRIYIVNVALTSVRHYVYASTMSTSGLRPAARLIVVIVRRRGHGCGVLSSTTVTTPARRLPWPCRRVRQPSRFYASSWPLNFPPLSAIVNSTVTVHIFLFVYSASLPMPTHVINNVLVYVLRISAYMNLFLFVTVSV